VTSQSCSVPSGCGPLSSKVTGPQDLVDLLSHQLGGGAVDRQEAPVESAQ
jgi:hypothetical protein